MIFITAGMGGGTGTGASHVTFEESFHLSNNVLRHGVQSVTDLMVRPWYD